MKSKHFSLLKTWKACKMRKKKRERVEKMFGSLKVRKHQQAGRQRQKPNVLFITFVKCTNSWNPQRLKHPEIPIYPASAPPTPPNHTWGYTRQNEPQTNLHIL